MNKEEALEFLRQHQPMPDDNDWSQDVLLQYKQVREYFEHCPDKECIPLFLNSFGERDGFGSYQLVEDVIIKFPAAEVIPHLLTALTSEFRSVRYWNAHIAASFPTLDLIEPLRKLLEEEDSDVVGAAAAALSFIPSDKITQILTDTMSKTKEQDSKDEIQWILNEMRDTESCGPEA